MLATNKVPESSYIWIHLKSPNHPHAIWPFIFWEPCTCPLFCNQHGPTTASKISSKPLSQNFWFFCVKWIPKYSVKHVSQKARSILHFKRFRFSCYQQSRFGITYINAWSEHVLTSRSHGHTHFHLLYSQPLTLPRVWVRHVSLEQHHVWWYLNSSGILFKGSLCKFSLKNSFSKKATGVITLHDIFCCINMTKQLH